MFGGGKKKHTTIDSVPFFSFHLWGENKSNGRDLVLCIGRVTRRLGAGGGGALVVE